VVILGRHFVNQARAESAWSAYFRLLPDAGEKGSAPDDAAILQQRADLLEETCSYGSADPDHYYRLGLANLEIFLQKQSQAKGTFSLAEARTILQGKRFADRAEAQAWLKELYGADLALLDTSQASFRRSLQCCPLLGQAYVRLAELCFLDDLVPPNSQPFCNQALLVRPNDPDIHLQVGFEAYMAGDLSTARQCWRAACRWQPDSKWKFLPLVAEQLPAADAAEFIASDFEGLKWLARKESEMGRKDASLYAVEQAQKALEADPERSKNPTAWIALHELYHEAQREPGAEACLRQALQRAPEQLGFHLHLIRWMMTQGRWEEALEQAQKARQSFPEKTELQNLLHDILVLKAPPIGGKDAKKASQAKTLPTGSKPP
jgi:tetratricopeptide (TPR) repeat protein